MLQKILNKLCSFALSIHKTMQQQNIDKNIVSWDPNQHIRMISDWSRMKTGVMAAENSAFHHHKNKIHLKIY